MTHCPYCNEKLFWGCDDVGYSIECPKGCDILENEEE